MVKERGPEGSVIADVIEREGSAILADWIRQQSESIGRIGRVDPEDLRAECGAFLEQLKTAVRQDGGGTPDGPAYDRLKELLGDMSRSRTRRGFSSSEVATFIFSFKQPLFARLQAHLAAEPERLQRAFWTATQLLDSLGLYTVQLYQRSREEVIARQQQEVLELSTPVVKLWSGILALPLIGTLDSQRTQVVMENLLQRIVEENATIAILDITGVPTVDTLVAQHLIKTVTAARLMGAECIISGIRPQIAQTIVHLGVDLSIVVTKATLADAFAFALQQRGARLAPGPA